MSYRYNRCEKAAMINRVERSNYIKWISWNASLSLTVPRTLAALPMWRATEIRCLKKLSDLWLSCERQSILKRCRVKLSLLLPKEPCNSVATSWKIFNPLFFRDTSQFYPLRPCRWLLHSCIRSLQSGDWLGARASKTVTPQTSCLPISQGIMEALSGHLLLVRYSTRGRVRFQDYIFVGLGAFYRRSENMWGKFSAKFDTHTSFLTFVSCLRWFENLTFGTICEQPAGRFFPRESKSQDLLRLYEISV